MVLLDFCINLKFVNNYLSLNLWDVLNVNKNML